MAYCYYFTAVAIEKKTKNICDSLETSSVVAHIRADYWCLRGNSLMHLPRCTSPLSGQRGVYSVTIYREVITRLYCSSSAAMNINCFQR